MARAGNAVRSGKTYRQLNRQSRPRNANQPEGYRDILFDTLTYTDNATTRLTFFGAAQADPTLSNMPQGGSLPSGVFFEIYEVCIDVFAVTGFVTTAAGGVVGAINDLGLLMVQGRPVISISMNQKEYGPWPALAAKGLGGPNGGMSGTFTAEENLQWGTHGRPGDGLFVDSDLTIPPLTPFQTVLQWNAAIDITADYRIRVAFKGRRFRKVQ